MTVLDASAILAFLQGEPGADRVEKALLEGAVCSAANWSEVVQKLQGRTGDWNLAVALLEAYEFSVEPVTRIDGEWAAMRWISAEGLSLADRLCLALGARQSSAVLTADRAWGSSSTVIQVR